MTQAAWPISHTHLKLNEEEVHVWTAPLKRTPDELEEMMGILSQDERDRALQLRSQVKRETQIAARGLLRLILGRYLDILPQRITFHYGPQGKPFLAPPLSSLHFNVTHSHDVALFAVAWGMELGVDVERIRPFSNEMGFAERYFSPRETQVLVQLTDEYRTHAFFNAWTRKEAFLKATGEGISSGLDRVEVSLHPDEPARLLCLNGDPHQAQAWALHALNPYPGYVGALCLPRHDRSITHFSWPESSERSLEVA